MTQVKVTHVRLFATPSTVQSTEFSRPGDCSGQPFPSPGDLANPGIEPRSPALQAGSLSSEHQQSLDTIILKKSNISLQYQ